MTDEPVDLSALDPTREGERYERLVSGIVADALAARRVRPVWEEPLLVLLRWSRPLLATAAGIALAASATILYRGAQPAPAGSLLESLGIPPVLVAWTESGRPPQLDALLAGVADAREDRQ